MPLEGEHEKDFGFDSPDGPVCQFDSENGMIKPAEEIFRGGVKFFADACTEGDDDLAARLTRLNMSRLPYWQKHPFAELNGPKASDAEFGAAMSKL